MGNFNSSYIFHSDKGFETLQVIGFEIEEDDQTVVPAEILE